MKRFLALVIVACLFWGCAGSEKYQQRKAQAEIDAANIPKCKDDAECKRFMAAANAWISKNSSLKVQIANENAIETYNPIKPYQWGCKVLKVPTVDGGYHLEFEAACPSCGSLFFEPIFKKADFNNYVWQMNPAPKQN